MYKIVFPIEATSSCCCFLKKKSISAFVIFNNDNFSSNVSIMYYAENCSCMFEWTFLLAAKWLWFRIIALTKAHMCLSQTWEVNWSQISKPCSLRIEYCICFLKSDPWWTIWSTSITLKKREKKIFTKLKQTQHRQYNMQCVSESLKISRRT